MPHDHKSETISGELQQLLFSPKGGIEGLLIKAGAKSLQVSMDPADTDAGLFADMIGKPIELTGSPDHSPKTENAAHLVYKLHSITKLAGKVVSRLHDTQPISGVVKHMHYAKHGEPNGVIIESGEFIHLRPPGMKKLKLKVGSKVVARGDIRMTVLGTLLIEAREVNRVTLE